MSSLWFKEDWSLAGGEEKIKRLAIKMRSDVSRPPANLKRIYKKIITTCELIEKYGGVAALVLAERSLRISEVKSMLEKKSAFSDELVQLVIEASKRKVRRKAD